MSSTQIIWVVSGVDEQGQFKVSSITGEPAVNTYDSARAFAVRNWGLREQISVSKRIITCEDIERQIQGIGVHTDPIWIAPEVCQGQEASEPARVGQESHCCANDCLEMGERLLAAKSEPVDLNLQCP